ncbi:Aspyridones efflux protein [Sparassis crispa]|uniref:Aspyridones efflux protein n=1 Tax=Sparassis crispa TaxID=139825 RepID=A0A401GU09_9APHY|nr:Aspyridones efflux protein [Sparassis crispa]GBE85712.1 Aspyridones efflux protein [Sparassis crispa]
MSDVVDSSETKSSTSTVVVTPPAREGPPPPPDGGLSAWSTIAGAWMIQFCTFGYVSAFGVYQDFYALDFLPLYSSSDISWIGGLQLFLMYAPGILVGRAFDAGYFHHLEIVGSLLYVFCMFMLSLTSRNQYYQIILAQGVGMGIGLGLTFLPSLSIVSHHFRRRRALAVGIVVSGASAGGIVFPIMLNRLFQDPHVGFAGGVRASGGLVGGLLLLANALVRTRAPPRRLGSRMGLSWRSFKVVLRDGAYMWSIAGAFFTSMGSYIPLFYLQLFASDHGVNARVTTYLLAILNAGSIVGRIIPPFLADKWGVYALLLPSVFASATLLFSIFGATTSAGAVIVGLLFGFASGAYISLIPSLLGVLCRDVSELGVRMGFAYTVVAIAMLVGNPIAGALLNADAVNVQRVWWHALVFAGLCTIVGFGFMCISGILFHRRKERASSA